MKESEPLLKCSNRQSPGVAPRFDGSPSELT
ncbi:hypothetical protein J3R73_006124 [Labrys monachus]|uniref:Uncharacterized protein n=1 Tax=Labrys monachus TaxID=217067 RepID=A0ABU0FPN5_9HYPH|nr:hypothetical protein [Labrys monachus]